MGLDRSGALIRHAARTNVTGDDTAYPSGLAPTGMIEVPAIARGSITHVQVRAIGGKNGVQCRITLFGAQTEDETQWYVLAQLNDGAVLTRTTKTPVADGNNINYLETFSHISAMAKLYPLIDATASLDTGVSVSFLFERP